MDDEFSQMEMAVLKSAGIEPKALTYTAFAHKAIPIFIRSYEAIYRQQLDVISNVNDAHSQAHNAAVLVDALKTNLLFSYPELRIVSVNALVNKDARVINTIMATLFQEGQRLWLEKLKSTHVQAPSPTEGDDNVPNDDDDCDDDLSDEPLARNRLEAEVDDGYSSEDSDFLLPNAVDPSQLIRGSLLEVKAKKIKRRRKRRKFQKKEVSSRRNFVEENSKLLNARPNKLPGIVKEGFSNRPSSAPTSRRDLRVSEVLQSKETPRKKPAKLNEYGEEIIYTYDMASGRRLVLTKAEAEATERQRAKEKNGDVRNMSDLDRRLAVQKAEQLQRMQAPTSTRPSWPGHSTERSVSEWLAKMRGHLESNGQLRANSPIRQKHVSTAVPIKAVAVAYEAYRSMEPLDLVVSIEHCCNCANHTASLRHKEDEYVNNADALVLALVEAIASSRPAVRLGVSRFSAVTSDDSSRIGSLEVQVAFRSRTKGLAVELLHSKLATMRWPSKAVMSKRMRVLLGQFDVKTFPDDPSSGVDMGEYDFSTSAGINDGPAGLKHVQWLFDARSFAGAMTQSQAKLAEAVVKPPPMLLTKPPALSKPPSFKAKSPRTPRVTESPKVAPAASISVPASSPRSEVVVDSSAQSSPRNQVVENAEVPAKIANTEEVISQDIPSDQPETEPTPTKLVYANGDVYQGETENGRRSGKGVYTRADPNSFGGVRFEGSWRDDDRIGTMKVTVRNGNELSAECEGSNWDGEGTVKLSNGEVYEGMYEGGLYCGRGKLRLTNGDVFEGDFKAGTFSVGTMNCVSGDIFKGELRNGARWQGELVSVDDSIVRYEGGEVVPPLTPSPSVATTEFAVAPVTVKTAKNYRDLQLSIKSIELSGSALKASVFDEIVCSVDMVGKTFTTAASTGDEARSDKRIFLTDFKGISITADEFKVGEFIFSIASIYEESILSTTIPLDQFFVPDTLSFEVQVSLSYEGVIIHAVFKVSTAETQGVVKDRIRKMDKSDLLQVKFTPLISYSQEENVDEGPALQATNKQISNLANLDELADDEANEQPSAKASSAKATPVATKAAPVEDIAPEREAAPQVKAASPKAVSPRAVLIESVKLASPRDSSAKEELNSPRVAAPTPTPTAPVVVKEEIQLPPDSAPAGGGEDYDDDYEDAYEDEFEQDNNVAVEATAEEQTVVADERLCLLDFTWSSACPWKENGSLSHWAGVVSDSEARYVLELNLGRKKLCGLIPVSIRDLQHLTVLSLFGNKLEGPLPEGLFEITTLRKLNVYDNSFSGTLSPAFEQLTSLEVVNLSCNLFTGSIPKALALPSLKEIYLHQNSFIGPVPVEFASLKLLTDMSCDLIPYSDFEKVLDWISSSQRLNWDTLYTGPPLPSEKPVLDFLCDQYSEEAMSVNEGWTNWGFRSTEPLHLWRGVHVSKTGNIQSLVLRNCSLVGPIPVVICKLEKLVYLDFSMNSLVGEVPKEFGAMKHIQFLHLDHNELSGSLACVSSIKTLRSLDLSYNRFEELPEGLKSLSVLETFKLDHNQITGEIPVDISLMSRLRHLDLSSNKIHGDLPAFLGKLRSMKYLNLSFNSITGTVPRDYSRCINLEHLLLEGNKIDYKAADMTEAVKLIRKLLPEVKTLVI